MKHRRVDPKVYTKKYYLSECTGYNEFKESYGEKLEPRFARIVQEFPNLKNKRILDVGTGRGEMCIYALKKGASHATGIDYSKDAIALAQKAAKKNKNIDEKVNFLVADAKKLPFEDNSFDVVFFIEVAEHLYPEELDQVFSEINRVLDDDGILFIHTAPSKTFNNITYKYYSYPMSSLLVTISNFLTGNSYPNIAHPSRIRDDSHLVMHVNEPTYMSLSSTLSKAGFYGAIRSTNVTINKPIFSWKDSVFNFLVYLYPLSTKFPFNIIWGNDFYVTARKHISKSEQIEQFSSNFWFSPQDAYIRYVEQLIWRKKKFINPVLDIGCGDGRIAQAIFWNKEKIEVGLDPDPNEIKNAKKKSLYKQLLTSKASTISAKNNYFSTVVSNSTFEHIDDDLESIDEIHRVLKKGGSFLFSTTERRLKKTFRTLSGKNFPLLNKRVDHKHYRSIDEWKKILESKGFSVTDSFTYMSDQQMKIWYRLYQFSTLKVGGKEMWYWMKDSRISSFFPQFIIKILLQYLLMNTRLQQSNGNWVFIEATKK